MAENKALRNLQFFRNKEVLVGPLETIKGQLEQALKATENPLILNDGEPITIRYKENLETTEIKSLFGVAYIKGGDPIPIKKILWHHNFNVEVSPAKGDVTLSKTTDDNNKITITAAVTTKLINSATSEDDGLAKAADVKSYVDKKIDGIAIPEVPEYTINKLTTAENGFIASYQLTRNGTTVGDTINLPKDYLVKKAELKTCNTENQPEAGFKVGDKYIDFIINTKDTENDEDSTHLYLNVKDLVDTYTAGKDISFTEGNVINTSLSQDITAYTKVGFLEQGGTLAAGSSLTQILTQILVKKVGIKTTTPTTTLSLIPSANKEIGTSLGTITLAPKYTDGYYSSDDTNIYTNAMFKTNNPTASSDGKLSAGCAQGNATFYKDNAPLTDADETTGGFQYKDETKVTTRKTYSFTAQYTYQAATVTSAKNNLDEEISVNIVAGTTAKSKSVAINFYYKTKADILEGVVWNEAKSYLEKSGTQYVPQTELKDVMTADGVLLTTPTINQNKSYSLPGKSSLYVILPKDKTFFIKNATDPSNKDLFGEFKQYTVVNTLGVNYDIYIFSNSGAGTLTLNGLKYSAIE